MKLGKKLIALTLAATLAMTCIVGCERKAVVPNNEEVVMVIDGEEIKMGLTNFFVRYQQSMVESMYVAYMGNNAWTQKTEDGATYEEGMKEALLTEFQKMVVVAQNAEEYEVALTEDELAEIEKAATAFDEANSAEVKELISGTKEIVTAYFKLVKLNAKMEDAIKAKADTEITEDEAETETTVEERQTEFYNETVEKWVEEAEIELKEDVWAKISLDGLSVLTVEEEVEEATDDDTTDDAADTTDDVADTTDTTTDESAE